MGEEEEYALLEEEEEDYALLEEEEEDYALLEVEEEDYALLEEEAEDYALLGEEEKPCRRLHALHHRCCSHLHTANYSAPRPDSPSRPTLASLRSPSPALPLTHEAPPYRPTDRPTDPNSFLPELPNYFLWNIGRPIERASFEGEAEVVVDRSMDGILVVHVADRFIMVRPPYDDCFQNEIIL
jgi:hypothetical protein